MRPRTQLTRILFTAITQASGSASNAAGAATTVDMQQSADLSTQLVTSQGGEATISLSGGDGGTVLASEDGQNMDPNSQTLVFQTDDGLILIRQPDGNFQVQSSTGAPINMDTVRALINQLQFA